MEPSFTNWRMDSRFMGREWGHYSYFRGAPLHGEDDWQDNVFDTTGISGGTA